MTNLERFECAFLAVRCLLSGTDAFPEITPESPGGRRAQARLSTGARPERARALADELSRIAKDVDDRRLV